MDARRDVGFGGMGRMFGRIVAVTKAATAAVAAPADLARPARNRKRCRRRWTTTPRRHKSKICSPNTKPRSKPSKPSFEAAQDDLKKVLTSKQEAEAYLLGLVR